MEQDTPTVRERRMPPSTLGPMINRARMRKGWRRREAERKLGIASGYLARIEMGARCPRPGMAEHLANGLDLTDEERTELAAMMRSVWGEQQDAATA